MSADAIQFLFVDEALQIKCRDGEMRPRIRPQPVAEELPVHTRWWSPSWPELPHGQAVRSLSPPGDPAGNPPARHRTTPIAPLSRPTGNFGLDRSAGVIPPARAIEISATMPTAGFPSSTSKGLCPYRRRDDSLPEPGLFPPETSFCVQDSSFGLP